MGLDGVELVMTLEEDFGIAISDEDAARMQTVGDMFDYLRAAPIKIDPIPTDEELWRHVTKIVVEQLGVKPEEVTREARFIEDFNVG